MINIYNYKIYKYSRIALFLLGIGLPYNSLAIGGNISVIWFTTFFYLITILPFFKKILLLDKVFGKIIYIPIIYSILQLLCNLFNYSVTNTPIFPNSLFLCVFLFYVFLTHAIYDSKSIDFGLYGIAIGCLLYSILFYLDIGVEYDENFRLKMFGSNSNELGIYLALGCSVILNEFIFCDSLKLYKFRFLFIILLVPIISMMFFTGSRTALLMLLFIILIELLMFQFKIKMIKYILILCVIISMGSIINYFMSSDIVVFNRLLTTIEDGDTSGRTDIWNKILPYIEDSPIWGYGQTGYAMISIETFGRITKLGNFEYGFSPHNVFIEILLYTGFVGLSLWLLFWTDLSFKLLYLYYKYKFLTPILLIVPALGCLVSGQFLIAKWGYFIYAYILIKFKYKQLNNK